MKYYLIALTILLFSSFSAYAAETTEAATAAFAKEVFDTTKSGDYAAYQKLFDPRCHPKDFTEKSFELRSSIVNKMADTATVEAMPYSAYLTFREKQGAPPETVNYIEKPSHIVLVHGTIARTTGDHIVLNPIVTSGNGPKVLEGDCLQ